MTKVLIVEDHASMRESLAVALTAAGDFSVVGEVPNADYALDFCRHLHPDLVLMDVCTEGGASGLKAVEDIRKSDEEIKIIVMTAFDEITYIPRAKAAGANGFIYKSRSLNDFLEVARAVMAGGSSFPEPKTIPLPQGEAPLTDREMEVLRLMCKHMTNQEIARELFMDVCIVSAADPLSHGLRRSGGWERRKAFTGVSRQRSDLQHASCGTVRCHAGRYLLDGCTA